MNDEKKLFGQRLKVARERAEMSQDELAQRVGYASRSSIGKIEAGKRDVTRPKILELAQALGVQPGYLMGWRDIDGEVLDNDADENYYHDPEAAALADMIKDNPRYRVLFEASRNLSADDVDFVIDMINKLAKTDEDFIE